MYFRDLYNEIGYFHESANEIRAKVASKSKKDDMTYSDYFNIFSSKYRDRLLVLICDKSPIPDQVFVAFSVRKWGSEDFPGHGLGQANP